MLSQSNYYTFTRRQKCGPASYPLVGTPFLIPLVRSFAAYSVSRRLLAAMTTQGGYEIPPVLTRTSSS